MSKESHCIKIERYECHSDYKISQNCKFYKRQNYLHPEVCYYWSDGLCYNAKANAEASS
jgi:hypothetical protein